MHLQCCRWRTCLIVRELELEIDALAQGQPHRNKLKVRSDPTHSGFLYLQLQFSALLLTQCRSHGLFISAACQWRQGAGCEGRGASCACSCDSDVRCTCALCRCLLILKQKC